MYSCGSLAPKMKRGGGGCMDHQFHKPAQPWEKSERYTAHKHTHISTSTHVCVSHFLALQLVCVCLHNYFTLSPSLILLQVYSSCIRTQSIKTMS